MAASLQFINHEMVLKKCGEMYYTCNIRRNSNLT